MLSLYRPAYEELRFRQRMLADAETMAYNRAWGGTIPFPEENWRAWYDRWIADPGGQRFYGYLKDDDGRFVGEAAWHWDDERGICLADVIIFAPERGRGYGGEAIELLCAAAARAGVTRLYDDIAADNPAIALFRRHGFKEVGREEQTILLMRELTPPDGAGGAEEKHMGLKLIKLTKAYEAQLGEMLEEWKADQERNHTDRSPGAIFKNDWRDFDYYLSHLERTEPTGSRVPDSVFFLLDEERDRLLGAVDIRHYLNDELLREGGHIGDGIRPTERRKGYATAMIGLALEECRKLGIDRVLMTCDRDNVGSAKSIQRNGGVLENEIVNSEGVVEQRYWITLG